MSYEIYITRADDHFDRSDPITIDQVRGILPSLPERFSIDKTGVISAGTPDGRILTADAGPFVRCAHSFGGETCVFFSQDDCPSFKARSYKQILDILPLAEALEARLQGEELEFYDRDFLLRKTAEGS